MVPKVSNGKILIKGLNSNHVVASAWQYLSHYNLVLESLLFDLIAGRLAPASEVAGGLTLPFLKGHGLPILKLYGMSSCDL
jgi:hypothetical protein